MKAYKLSQAKAKAIAEQVVGSSKGLVKDRECRYDLYTIKQGIMAVRIHYDPYCDRIVVVLSTGIPEKTYLLLDPRTLERDRGEEEIQRRERERKEVSEG